MKQPSVIYLDTAAATPILPIVLRAMRPFFSNVYGNPSSITQVGLASRRAIEASRSAIACVLQSRPEEIIFTSGGTESDNAALNGIMESFTHGHLICSQIEHQAVLAPADALKLHGYSVTTVRPDSTGRIAVENLLKAIQPESRLISLMLANNELGTVQPVFRLARELRRINRIRQEKGLSRVYLHTDACQAGLTLKLDVQRLGVDAMTVNAAKLGGPKGIGFLYLRRGTPFRAQLLGGGQEQGRRAGTENVPGIVGLAVALEQAQKQSAKFARRATKFRQRFLDYLLANIPDCVVNGHPTEQLPTHISLTVQGVDAEALVLALDQDGVIIAAGAACSNWTLEPSHVLRAIGKTNDEALQTIRLSFDPTIREYDLMLAGARLSQQIRWARQTGHGQSLIATSV